MDVSLWRPIDWTAAKTHAAMRDYTARRIQDSEIWVFYHPEKTVHAPSLGGLDQDYAEPAEDHVAEDETAAY
tara:strand:- start:824 stop:1039 length:216 start_codon:yes stop_codon:yes gene_type:complete